MNRHGSSTRLAGLVLGVAMFSYLIAVVGRTSLGVAGMEATERFGLTATTLAAFSVVQLAVYAGMQVPGGLLLDRFGARALIGCGALTMAGGQLILALTTSFPVAMVGRVLIGAGDAVTFISVIRLVTAWFPARQVPMLSQVTGLVGQAGQIVSAVPLVAVLHGRGWTAAFLALAGAGLFAGIAALAAIRDQPAGAAKPPGMRLPARELLVGALKTPGTQLGFWSHFLTPFSANSFMLLWGFGFLVSAEGMSTAQASALFTTHVLVAMVTGPVVGMFVAHHPLRRSWAVICVAVVVALAWLLVLLPSTPRPFWVLLVFVALLATGGPASLVGLDFARTSNPAGRLGTATGIVNVGGFVATIVSVFAIGLVLAALTPDGQSTYSLSAYRWAFGAQLLVWMVGLTGVLRARGRVRAQMARDGVVVPSMREVLARRQRH